MLREEGEEAEWKNDGGKDFLKNDVQKWAWWDGKEDLHMKGEESVKCQI